MRARTARMCRNVLRAGGLGLVAFVLLERLADVEEQADRLAFDNDQLDETNRRLHHHNGELHQQIEHLKGCAS